MEKYSMVGKLLTLPGKRDEMAAILLEAADMLRAQEGCRHYVVHVSEQEPDAVWVTELWDSKEAHAASLQREDVLALISRARPLITGMEPLTLRPIGGVGF